MSKLEDWFNISRKDMVADIGTGVQQLMMGSLEVPGVEVLIGREMIL